MAPADGGGGAGGNGGRWSDTLPEDIRSSPVLASVPDVATLAKNYINAEKMIGAKRIAVPGQNAQPSEWDGVWNALGRPETHDKYGKPTAVPADGLVMDQANVDNFRSQAHKLGLTDSQFRGVMDFYIGGLNQNHKSIMGSMETARASATEALRRDWGDKFDANMDVAKTALRTFGGDDVFQELESGLGNHVGLIRMLHTIGTRISEGRTRDGGPGMGGLKGSTQAVQEIETLKMDSEFQKALNGEREVGHKQAVERWLDLHRRAFPGVQT
jgi:hypothetical protein